MQWTVIALLALAGFLVGGAYSFFKQKRRNAAIVLSILAVMSVAAAFLWAWEPV
ncbi:MAG: hypothetical protein ACR2KE_02540 [Candidatus Nanopelagicales bacterium]